MTTEPKPCPFCGGECDPEGWLGGYKTTGPECSSCGATAENVEAWNRRAALSPASGQEANECRLTLLVQVHELCDQIERTLHTFGTDEEGRKQAEGAVAYARKVSQPFNYNGPFRAAPAQQVEAEIRDKALDEAIEAIDTGFDTIGDAASYDNRDLSPSEMEQLDAAIRCINIVRSLKSAAGSNNGEKGE